MKKDQVNYSYIKLNEINNKSFEIIYFNKKIENLPTQLNVKMNDKEYLLQESCKSDIPFIKKFDIINCNSSLTINAGDQDIYVNEESEGSYKVDIISQDNNNYIMKIKKLQKKSILI